MKLYPPPPDVVPLQHTHTRPIYVVDDLAALRGPTAGTHRLPLHLDWGRAAEYDLGDPVRVRTMYATVLREAASEADLETHLNRATLQATWATLNLPTHIRTAWEATHPQLRDGEQQSGLHDDRSPQNVGH